MRRNAVAAVVIAAVTAWAAPTVRAQYFDVGKLPAPPVFGPEIAANVKSFSETYRGRVTGTVQEKMAATFLRDEAAKLGYDAQIVTFSAGGNDPGAALQAVVATKRGLTKPDEHILFVGHYDTIASTIDGAYDNGSGTTMMRALSKSIAGLPTNRTVVFVWYNAEEEGLLASQRHAAQWKAQNKATRAVLGFDMTGIAYPVAAPDPNSCLCMWHGQDDEGFVDLLRYVNFQVLGFPDAPTLVEIPGVNVRNSDEREFDRQGYPVLRWAGRRTAASYRAYHMPDDTMATMEAVAGGRQFVEEGLRNTLLSSYYTFLALDNEMPVASAVATGDRTVTFSAAASRDPDGPPSAFRWNFGDGATGTGQTVTHSYDQAGEYVARLTVEDNIWPQVTASATVRVRVFAREGATSRGGALTLTAKARRVSARKTNRRRLLAVSVRTNRPVQKVVGSLKKGRKVIGKGTLRNFRGSGTLKLRFSKRKKLKAGRYSVVVKATEASGRSLTRTLRLKVGR